MLHDQDRDEQAIAWAVRVADPQFADWDGFTAWLEEDAANALAYDRVAGAVTDAVEAQAAYPAPAGPVVANDDVADTPRFSRRWLGGAVAAALALATSWSLLSGGGTYTVETAPGETRQIALDDGSTVMLAGGTRMTLDEDDQRFASLESGRALFTIVHDEADPFVLEAGGDRLVDAGTVFDVRLGADMLAVGVSEGAVILNPDAQDARIEPGQLLQKAPGAREYTVREIAAEQVGEWTEGRLTFEQASLDDVAAQLRSATGIDFAVEQGNAGMEISGSLLVEPIRDDPRALEPLLGLSVRMQRDRWIIGSR